MIKTFKEFNKDLNTKNVNKAIQQGDFYSYSNVKDFVKVDDHSLTESGVIEEYYVTYEGKFTTIQANEVTEMRSEAHLHSSKKKKK